MCVLGVGVECIGIDCVGIDCDGVGCDDVRSIGSCLVP